MVRAPCPAVIVGILPRKLTSAFPVFSASRVAPQAEAVLLAESWRPGVDSLLAVEVDSLEATEVLVTMGHP
jgi:hypothetical protein